MISRYSTITLTSALSMDSTQAATFTSAVGSWNVTAAANSNPTTTVTELTAGTWTFTGYTDSACLSAVTSTDSYVTSTSGVIGTCPTADHKMPTLNSTSYYYDSFTTGKGK